MRIDGYVITHDAPATDVTRRADQDGPARPGGPPATPAGSTDRVELSRDSALVTAALQLASDASGVRADRVETGREMLKAGRVGADPVLLADAMLNDLLR